MAPDLFLRSYAPAVTVPLHVEMPIANYIAFWSEHVDAVHQYAATELGECLARLAEDGLIRPRQCEEALNRVAQAGCRSAMLQPGLSVTAQWPWTDAVALDDERGRLAREIAASLEHVLKVLGEAPRTAAASAA